MNAEVVRLPNTPTAPTPIPMDPADVADLYRLREMERNQSRPVAELNAALQRLERIAFEARIAVDKVIEHERKGWTHIKVGAFRKLAEEFGLEWK